MNWPPVIFVAAVALVWVTIDLIVRRNLLRRLLRRGCMGRQWRERFPAATRDEIRNFLHTFINAFNLPRRRPLAFSPDDRLIDLYRVLNPFEGLPDAMEFEMLADAMERRYALTMPDWSAELTLGELFKRAMHRGPAR